MDKKLSEIIEEFKIEPGKISNLIIYMAGEFCLISANELKKYNINKKYFIMTRSLVIEIHSLLESYIERLITNYFIDNIHLHKVSIFNNVILEGKTFGVKMAIFEKIYKFQLEKSCFVTLKKINKIRNTFVHPSSVDDKKFNYNVNISIFNAKGIIDLIDDAFRIIDIFKKTLPQPNFSSAIAEAIKKEASKHCILGKV